MRDTADIYETTDTLDICPYGDVTLHDVHWNCEQDTIHHDDINGSEYGEPYGFEFVYAKLGGLKITRDMLVEMLSEAEVSAIEESRNPD